MSADVYWGGEAQKLLRRNSILEKQGSQGKPWDRICKQHSDQRVSTNLGETTGTVKTAASDREQKYSDHQPSCLLKYFYCLTIHYFERLKTDFLEPWAWGCCWSLNSGSHRCGECAAQSPPVKEMRRPCLFKEQRRFQFGYNRPEWLFLFVNWKMNLERQAHWDWNKLWTELCREAFVQIHPWFELVFIIDERTAGQVLSTWLCAHTTISLFRIELCCIFQFQVCLFYSLRLFYLFPVFSTLNGFSSSFSFLCNTYNGAVF